MFAPETVAVPRPSAAPKRSLVQTAIQQRTTYTLALNGVGSVPRYGDPSDMFVPVNVHLCVVETKDHRGMTRSRFLKSIVAENAGAYDAERYFGDDIASIPEYLRWVITECGFEELLEG